MPSYSGSSPLGSALMAVSEQLMLREQMKRQAQLDALMKQRQEAEIRQRDQDLSLRSQQLAQVDADRDAVRQNTEADKRFRRATTIATVGLPGVIDTDTASLLRDEGYGTLVQHGQPTQGAFRGDDDYGVPQYDVLPGVLEFAGGTTYQNARTAAQERAAAATQAQAATAERATADRAAANERAAEANQTRALIAGMAAQGKSETTALRNDLLQTQIDAARNKQEEKVAADKRAKDAARVTAGSTLDVLKQLADFTPDGKATLKPGVGQLFGARMPGISMIPGTRFADASAALERLKGRVIVDLLNEMKNQSRTGATGFGSLNRGELDVIQNASSQLNSSGISDQRAAEEMRRIFDTVTALYEASAGTPQAADPLGIR